MIINHNRILSIQNISIRTVKDYMSKYPRSYDKADSEGNFLIHRIARESPKTLEYYLKHTNKVNTVSIEGDTPLHDAVSTVAFGVEQSIAKVDLLVNAGADLFAVNSEGKTPLEFATAAARIYLDLFKESDVTYYDELLIHLIALQTLRKAT